MMRQLHSRHLRRARQQRRSQRGRNGATVSIAMSLFGGYSSILQSGPRQAEQQCVPPVGRWACHMRSRGRSATLGEVCIIRATQDVRRYVYVFLRTVDLLLRLFRLRRTDLETLHTAAAVARAESADVGPQLAHFLSQKSIRSQ